MYKPCRTFLFIIVLIFLFDSQSYAQSKVTPDLAARFQKLSDTFRWNHTASIPLAFTTHHPQGMVKAGNHFYMSSVEVINREAGKGVGHLYKFDDTGKLLADIILGDGAIYHPGGIDFDGEFIWVPVSEYRPNSHSIIYKMDAETLVTTEVFRFNDHIGAIVHNTKNNTLHGVSWGSRKYYSWKLNSKGFVKTRNQNGAIINPSFYIDYQDCHYAGNNLMLCGGLKNYKKGILNFGLGGIELVNLKTHQPVYQLAIPLWSPGGRPITQNPFWLETTAEGLRGYFAPDDNTSTLFVYDIKVY